MKQVCRTVFSCKTQICVVRCTFENGKDSLIKTNGIQKVLLINYFVARAPHDKVLKLFVKSPKGVRFEHILIYIVCLRVTKLTFFSPLLSFSQRINSKPNKSDEVEFVIAISKNP